MVQFVGREGQNGAARTCLLAVERYTTPAHWICIQEFVLKTEIPVLPAVAQWVARQLVNQKVAGFVPGQGTSLGWGPPWGCV